MCVCWQRESCFVIWLQRCHLVYQHQYQYTHTTHTITLRKQLSSSITSIFLVCVERTDIVQQVKRSSPHLALASIYIFGSHWAVLPERIRFESFETELSITFILPNDFMKIIIQSNSNFFFILNILTKICLNVEIRWFEMFLFSSWSLFLILCSLITIKLLIEIFQIDNQYLSSE